jgi:putative salt-induced outer membrane protein YdiY
MVKKKLAAIGAVLMLHGVAYAATALSASSASGSESDEKDPAAAATWAAQAQLGLIVTSGSTTTKSGNAAFDAAHQMNLWTLSGGFAALYASTGPYSTQQDTNAHVQADLALSKRTFWFTTARWDRNLFTGFAYQDSIATGAGFKFIETPATLLAGELGVGYRIESPETLTTGPAGNVISRVHVPGSLEREAVLQAGVNYSHSITESTKLTNALLVQYGSSDTTTTDNLSLQVKVDATLSLAVGMQLVNNSSPPPGSAKHTDTVVTINLVYAVKNPKLSATAGTPALVSGFNLP